MFPCTASNYAASLFSPLSLATHGSHLALLVVLHVGMLKKEKVLMYNSRKVRGQWGEMKFKTRRMRETKCMVPYLSLQLYLDAKVLLDTKMQSIA